MAKAVRLAGKLGLSWNRAVNFQTGNSTGTVAHGIYCAPKDQWLPREDAPKCCSRQTRELNVIEQGGATGLGELNLVACQ